MADATNSSPDDVARAIIRYRLREIASEILTWNRTGLLPNGALREAAQALEPIFRHEALGVAQKWATDAALEVVANGR